MADYNKATNFTAKDGLPSGNAGKIVKGTEIDIEFSAISNAIASKADINSAALTGSPTAPTASAGTNTTQLATTAFVSAALSAVYPVGSIYINATSASNPNTLLGFGTWTAFGAGRVMVGLDASDALFDTAEETGGSKDATLPSHTHTASSSSSVSDPGHFHLTYGSNGAGGNGGGDLNSSTGFVFPTTTASTGISVSTSTTVNTAGSSATNANVQPYITVRMWKRTA